MALVSVAAGEGIGMNDLMESPFCSRLLSVSRMPDLVPLSQSMLQGKRCFQRDEFQLSFMLFCYPFFPSLSLPDISFSFGKS